MRLGQVGRLGGLVVLLTMVGVGSAHAAIITYQTQAAWEAAVAAAGLTLTLEDFADATLQPGVTANNGSVSGGVFNGAAITQFNNAGNPWIGVPTQRQWEVSGTLRVDRVTDWSS